MAEAQPRARGPVRKILAALVWVAALATLLSLGTWQVQRLAWKEKLLADISERRTEEPVTLEAIEAMERTGGDIEYRPLSVTGTFDHDKERHFLATWNGQSGYHVYTPLLLADGRYVFINRGFAPFEKKEARTRGEGQIAGGQTLSGLAREKLDGKPSSLVPDNDISKNVFYWKDLDAMAASTGIAPANLVPFFIDADSATNPGGLPVGGVTQFEMPNNHLQYALTWYGLALAMVGVSGVYIWRARR
ncbi:SURF1 family protein [Rhizobium sp. ARZ01]|uniref:SURF1 family cytochrome oxidase biogenesis protein n=1 Tax=Rhizobium sp. ARZ01 TaxID=2769313 RepID=UPI00177B8158|nr:SURF1 family protein [Rhizobium sp. ARZ01]